MTETTHSNRTAELFVRSQAGTDVQTVQRHVVERLHDLEARGGLDRVDVWVWGKEVCPEMPLDGRSAELSTIGRVRRFEEWADRQDEDVALGFQRRTIRSAMAGEREETTVITLPVLSLAVYEDDDLVGVFPCREGDRRCSIEDALDRLETDGEASVEELVASR